MKWVHVRYVPAGSPLNAPEHPAHLREGPLDHDRWLCKREDGAWFLLVNEPGPFEQSGQGVLGL